MIDPNEPLGIEAAAPVRTVVLLEDRAQVTRHFDLDLPAGPSRITVREVTPLVADRTLVPRASSGLRVEELRVRRRWRVGVEEKPANVRELASEEQRLSEAIADHERVQQVAARRRALLANAAHLLVDSVNRELPYATRFEPRWESELEEVCRKVRDQDGQMAQAQLAIEAQKRDLAAVRARQWVPPTPSEVFEASMVLDVTAEKAGRYSIDVEYTVPCALWRPIHRATLVDGEVRFECEAAVWQNTGEDWTDVTLKLSTARSTERAEPPVLQDEWLQAQRRVEKKVTVRVREKTIATTGEGTTQHGLPGVDDGGETRLLDAATKATIVSDGRMRRVAVFQFTAPAEIDRICCPEIEPLVHLRARQANTSKQPILAGPVDLLRSSGYVGRSQVAFVASGERFALGFGSEDGVRVRREQWATEERSALTGKQTVTRRVRLFLSNLDDHPASFTVQERIPVSEIDKVKVEISAKETKPAAAADDQGIVTWKATVTPHGTDQLQLTYLLIASSDVQGLAG